MLYFLVFLLILAAVILVTRPLTVLLHELGHAIAILFLTKKKVTIYIGSYGDPEKSFKINLGWLLIFFRYNPFKWRLGLCIPSAENISMNKQIVYTLAGPLASFTLATIACYFTFTYDLHGLLKLFLVVFFISAIIDLLVNLIPSETPVVLHDGTITYNDGQSLKQLLQYSNLHKANTKGYALMNDQKFAAAALLFEKILAEIKEPHFYRVVIACHIRDKNFQKAVNFSEELALTGNIESEDLISMAFSYSELGYYEKALEFYDKSLDLDPDNKYSLNNKGYTLTVINRYEEAIPFFDRALELDKDFAFSFNNRGLAKIKTGQIENGLRDIQHSLKIDPDNAYGYRNIGIYHFDKGEFDKALELFNKAKKINQTTHSIDELIQDATRKITTQQEIKTISL